MGQCNGRTLALQAYARNLPVLVWTRGRHLGGQEDGRHLRFLQDAIALPYLAQHLVHLHV
jgi:hypothetical protein